MGLARQFTMERQSKFTQSVFLLLDKDKLWEMAIDIISSFPTFVHLYSSSLHVISVLLEMRLFVVHSLNISLTCCFFFRFSLKQQGLLISDDRGFVLKKKNVPIQPAVHISLLS